MINIEKERADFLNHNNPCNLKYDRERNEFYFDHKGGRNYDDHIDAEFNGWKAHAEKQQENKREIASNAVMNFVDLMIQAFDSGFVDNNNPTLSEIHRVAENHIKDIYGIEVKTILERQGEDLAIQCGAKKSPWELIETAPKNKSIFIFYINSYSQEKVTKCKYIEKFTEEYCGDDEDWADYREDDDKYYCPEGWYEISDNNDDIYAYALAPSIKPTHWMPVPNTPKGDGND